MPLEAPCLVQHPNETILVVDNDLAVLGLLRTILKQAGYKVLEARAGQKAVELSRIYDSPIHLLLTDVMMDSMNGPDLADRLLSFLPSLRIVFMSGSELDYDVQRRVRESGAYLEKPFTPDTLLKQIRRALDAPQPERAFANAV